MSIINKSVLFNSIYPKLEKHIHPLKLLEELEKAYAERHEEDDWNLDHHYLNSAFVWVMTPQGVDFWSRLSSKCHGH